MVKLKPTPRLAVTRTKKGRATRCTAF